MDEAFRLGDEVVVLKDGGVIAQRGSPHEILSSPADEFVREFVGIDRADRQLTTDTVGGRTIVLDGDGRPVGVMAS
jgi:osmoprotectant transport system ATP-binding protein